MYTTKKRLYNKNNATKKIIQQKNTNKLITAVIDTKAIVHNIQYLKKKSKTDIMPILKADAYGHGMVNIAKLMRKNNITYIGVATLDEAILLRENGDNGRILFWLYDIYNKNIHKVIDYDLDIAIYDETHIPLLEKIIPFNKKLKVTLFIDTGINRGGISYNFALQAFQDVNNSNKFELVGMMSHLVSSQIKNNSIVKNQLYKFRSLRQMLQEMNIIPPLVHIANTCACLNYDVSDFTISRCGTGIFGITSTTHIDNRFNLTMSIISSVIQIKNINKGEGIGYDWKFIAKKNMKIGIVPIGYADIIPFSSSLGLFVYINGSRRKVLGLINMDQIVIQLHKNDKNGDKVYLFGNGKNCKQTIFDIAPKNHETSIEMLSHIGNRVHKIYL